jgi:hypothetical protein
VKYYENKSKDQVKDLKMWRSQRIDQSQRFKN